jgi:GntR family transcriptional regulator, transcriptional repressor for pyruvate dehydrogenase complex
MVIKAGDIVIKNLIDAVIKGELKPGDRLPSLEHLAKKSGTSVLSAREAVQNLAVIGILDICHGKGIFLTEGAPVIEELLEARRTLESYFAMMAAENGNPELIKDLEALLTDMDGSLAAGDIESYSEKDIDFHYAIAKASGNRILFKTLINIRNLLRYQLFTINRMPGIIAISTERHKEVFKAIRKKEPERARTWMWQHITETIENWKQDISPLHQQKTAKDKLAAS